LTRTAAGILSRGLGSHVGSRESTPKLTTTTMNFNEYGLSCDSSPRNADDFDDKKHEYDKNDCWMRCMRLGGTTAQQMHIDSHDNLLAQGEAEARETSWRLRRAYRRPCSGESSWRSPVVRAVCA
jgi:hypothetical protein